MIPHLRASLHLSLVVGFGLAVSGASVARAQNRTVDLELDVGQQTSISARNVRSYSEGVGGIAAVRLTEDQTRFVIVGQRAGTTSLLLIMQDGGQTQYRITVGGGEPETDDTDGVPERENIRLDLYFVQLSDSYSHSIGLGWPGSLGSDSTLTANITRIPPTVGAGGIVTTPARNETTFALIAQTALPRLELAQASGWARVFRQAAVVTANGTRAEFQNGGEVNIIVSGGLTGALRTIEFGTKLKMLPRYDPETHRLEVQIDADISDLTDDRGTGVPGRITSRVRSLVNLELGQSIVIAGIIARTDTRSRTGLPGLSQIPVIGALFGVHARREEQNEALLFIVPSVVEAVPLTRRNRIQEALRVYEDFRGGTEEVELLEQPRIRRRSGSAASSTPITRGSEGSD
ncbi:MAG: type II and III secretion system protein [Deltaproteobacteria bacterium]|nr:type II and III secretion system protein [Deltaproteobacteria bacterium]